jgi:hypothetical protein
MKELKREFVKLIIIVKLNFSPHLPEGRKGIGFMEA